MSHSGEPAPEPFSDAERDRLVRLAYRFLWNQDDAEDVVQESLAAAHARQHQLEDAGRWWSWLRRIVIHRCHTAGRGKARWRVHGPRLAETRADRAEDSAASEVDAGDRRELVRRALPLLPPRQREVIVLRHLEGMSYEHIAELLEISPVTARVHARAGLEALRAALAEPEVQVPVRKT